LDRQPHEKIKHHEWVHIKFKKKFQSTLALARHQRIERNTGQANLSWTVGTPRVVPKRSALSRCITTRHICIWLHSFFDCRNFWSAYFI